jgi:hypothetical protein
MRTRLCTRRIPAVAGHITTQAKDAGVLQTVYGWEAFLGIDPWAAEEFG